MLWVCDALYSLSHFVTAPSVREPNEPSSLRKVDFPKEKTDGVHTTSPLKVGEKSDPYFYIRTIFAEQNLKNKLNLPATSILHSTLCILHSESGYAVFQIPSIE